MVRVWASIRLSWPVTTFSQVGDEASSKSASHTRAPELRALTVILRSVGPVISTRRSSRASGAGATRQESSARIAAVSGRKPSVPVRAISARRSARRASSSSRRGVNRRCSAATKASAGSVRTSSCRGRGSASTMTSGDGAGADIGCHFLRRAGHGVPDGPEAAWDALTDPGPPGRWIVVSSWWKFNVLLPHSMVLHSRCARSASVSMSYASATSPHSTSTTRSACSPR